MDVVGIVGALAGFMAVVATGTVAVITLRSTRAEAAAARSHEFLLAVLPRRLQAFEAAWHAVFQVESGVRLTTSDSDKLIELSLWLPRTVRDQVMRLIATDYQIDPGPLGSTRQALEDASGSTALDRIQQQIAAGIRTE